MAHIKKSTRSAASQARSDARKARNTAQNLANLDKLGGYTYGGERPSVILRRQARASDPAVQARAVEHAEGVARARQAAAEKQARTKRQSDAKRAHGEQREALLNVAKSVTAQ